MTKIDISILRADVASSPYLVIYLFVFIYCPFLLILFFSFFHIRPSTGAPVPPPRKVKKNGTIKQPEESSPCTERKENVKPELITATPTDDPNLLARKKPPRPPPPPRGSSLGRKSTLLANIQGSPSADKKTKPPVPPKPKNYVPKKVSSTRIVSVKSDTSKVSQPTKSRADSAPAFSTTSDSHESQFFVNSEKETAPSSESHDSRTSSQFFVTKDKENAAPLENIDSKTLSQFFVSLEGKPTGEFKRMDKAIDSVANGTTDRSKVRKTGKRITSGKGSPDPLECLEITTDAFSDEEGDFSMEVHKDEKENPLSESVDVNGVIELESTDVVMSDQPCDEIKPTDSLSEPKQSVKIVYSVELEEECSVTMIEDTSKRQEPEDNLSDKRTRVFELKEEEEEMRESEKKMDELDLELHKEMPDEKSFEQIEVLENSNSEPLPVVATEEEKKNIEVSSDVDYVNKKEDAVSNFVVEKPTEDDEMCDIDILDNLSDDDDDKKISESNASIEEFYKRTMDVELEGDSQVEDLDSPQNGQENQKDENADKVVMTVAELQQDKPQGNSEVIMAEAIREGTLISVSDRAVSEGALEVGQEEEVVNNEDSEGVDDREVSVKETSEITVSLSENKLDIQADIETSIDHDDVNDEIEEQCTDSIVESQPDLTVSGSEELKSKDTCIVTEANEEEKTGEHLLEDAVSESKEEDTAELAVCSSENVVHLEAENELDSTSVVEPTLETLKDGHVVECTIDIAPAKQVGAESQVNEDAEEPNSPTSPPPTKPERRNRQARRQRHTYINVDPTKNRLEELKSGTSVRKVHSFSKYETVVHSLPRPVQRVSDDEAIYRVPSKVIPVESYAYHESEYSVPYPISSRNVVEDNGYAVPKPIVARACAVTGRREVDDGGIYSVPGQVTSVPVVEKFAEPSNSKPAHVAMKEGDNIYAIPTQEQHKTINAVSVTTEEAQQKKATTVTVSATPPPKPPRYSLTKDDMMPKVDLGDTTSSSSTEAVARESPKPAPRTREQRNSPSPIPRKSSKTAESSESGTPPSGGSPVPAPRIRLNALHSSREAASSNLSSSEPSTLSSSEVSTLESTEEEAKSTEEEATLKRKPPPRPPPPTSRISMSNNDDGIPPPVSPGPFGNDVDSDSDSDVGEDTTPKVRFVSIMYSHCGITEREHDVSSYLSGLKKVLLGCLGQWILLLGK